jgi:hypothetical protein
MKRVYVIGEPTLQLEVKMFVYVPFSHYLQVCYPLLKEEHMYIISTCVIFISTKLIVPILQLAKGL